MNKDFLKNKNIICFDGICSLCNGFILLVAKNDKKDCFRFISLQNPILENFINENLSKHSDSIILITNQKIKTKSDAILSIFKELCYPFRIIFIFRFIPKFIRDYIYSNISKNRHLLFKKINTCSIVNKRKYKNFIKNKLIE
tara:strand:- start:868 stop:1293 length:426 start_codon:yes stop_codon:yes gene_type:complete